MRSRTKHAFSDVWSASGAGAVAEQSRIARAKGLIADLTDVAPFFATVNPNIAFAGLPSCNTVDIGTKYGVWVHAGLSFGLVTRSIHQHEPISCQSITSSPRLTVVVPNILFPGLFFNLVGMQAVNFEAIWQVVGMFVLVYAPAYWWAARFPFRHRHFIVIGFIGKLLGPIGFIWAVSMNDLPAVFGWTILTNDLIWLPAFFIFLREVAHSSGGWQALLKGE